MDKILQRNKQLVRQNIALLDAFFEDYKHILKWVIVES